VVTDTPKEEDTAHSFAMFGTVSQLIKVDRTEAVIDNDIVATDVIEMSQVGGWRQRLLARKQGLG